MADPFDSVAIKQQWQNCSLLGDIIRSLPADKMEESLLYLRRYEQCLEVFFSRVDCPLRSASPAYLPQVAQESKLPTSNLSITWNSGVSLSQLLEKQVLICTLFSIQPARIQFLQAFNLQNTTILWRIPNEYISKVLQNCSLNFWMLLDDGISEVQVNNIFKLSLKGEETICLIRDALLSNKDLLTCTKVSHQMCIANMYTVTTC